MNTSSAKPLPYRRALLMAGGGLRFGYYLGIYQALCDTGRMPDLVIGNCGGAMATALLLNVLANSPDHTTSRQTLIDIMTGRSCYESVGSIQDKPPSKYDQYILPAFMRWINCQMSKQLHRHISPTHLTHKLINNLTHHAIGHIHDETRTPCWRFEDTLAPSDTPTHALILASRLICLHDRHEWQGTLWTSHPKLHHTITNLAPTNVIAHYSPLIHPDYHLNHLPLSIMVRASATDMYYLPPLHHDNELLMGGVMDLTPIELACQLAEVVYAEPKTSFDYCLAEPAIHQVFGYLPNVRLCDVHDYMASHSQIRHLDTKDYRHIRPLFDKKPNLWQGRIQAIHHDFATFTQIITEQFDYGYHVGINSIE